MHVASDGALWIGTDEGGLVRFDPASETFEAYYDGNLPFINVTSIAEGRHGQWWLGTFFGPARFDPATGEAAYIEFSSAATTPTNALEGPVVADDEGFLWSVTRIGLFRIDPERGVARNMGVTFGLFRWRYLKLSSGEILFGGGFGGGGEEGLLVLDPAALLPDTTPPRVLLESLTAERPSDGRDGTSTNDADGESETEALSLYDRASLDLPYARNDVTIAYVGLEYDAPEAVTYEYQLEGYDARWQEAGGQRSARYTNLPAGHYTFRVRARNADGYWSDPDQAGASFALVVHPPWWQTWWARLLGVLAVVGVAVLGGRRYARQVERQAEERAAVLEATVAERTAELRAEKATTEAQARALSVQTEELRELDAVKSRFFANVSHELRTPLTLLLGPVKDALDPENEHALDRLRRHLPIMARNGDRLLTLIGQLLDLAKLEGGGMHLHARELDLVVFVGALTDGFAGRAEQLGLTLVFDAGGRSLPVWADADKLEKVVVNLVSNAVKFTPEGGKVRVRVGYCRSPEGERAELAVQDTGPGIPAAELARVFDRFHQVDGSTTRAHEGTGIGLALARELVELHRGTLSVESTEGFGSTFAVRLPLGREHLGPDEIVDESRRGGRGGLGPGGRPPDRPPDRRSRDAVRGVGRRGPRAAR